MKYIDKKQMLRMTLLCAAITTAPCISYAATDLYSSGSSSDSKFAIGANVGFYGVGVEARSKLTDQLFGRLGVNYFQFTHNSKKGDGGGKLSMLNIPLMLDFHPFENSGFKMSIGASYSDMSLSFQSLKSGIKVNGNEYNGDMFDKIEGKVSTSNKIAPIASIGYDGSIVSGSGFSFNAEFGVSYHGKIKVKSDFTPNKKLKYDLSVAKKDIDKYFGQQSVKNELSLFYPVVNVGVKYSF